MTALILTILTPFAFLGILWLRYLAEGNTADTFRQFCRWFFVELKKPIKAPSMPRHIVPLLFEVLVSITIVAIFGWYSLWVLPMFWFLSFSFSR